MSSREFKTIPPSSVMQTTTVLSGIKTIVQLTPATIYSGNTSLQPHTGRNLLRHAEGSVEYSGASDDPFNTRFYEARYVGGAER